MGAARVDKRPFSQSWHCILSEIDVAGNLAATDVGDRQGTAGASGRTFDGCRGLLLGVDVAGILAATDVADRQGRAGAGASTREGVREKPTGGWSG